MEPPRLPPRIPHHPRAIGNRRGPPRGAVRCGARPRIAPRRHRHGGATPRRAEANPAAGRDAAPCALLARLPVAAAVYMPRREDRRRALEGSCECEAAERGGGGVGACFPRPPLGASRCVAAAAAASSGRPPAGRAASPWTTVTGCADGYKGERDTSVPHPEFSAQRPNVGSPTLPPPTACLPLVGADAFRPPCSPLAAPDAHPLSVRSVRCRPPPCATPMAAKASAARRVAAAAALVAVVGVAVATAGAPAAGAPAAGRGFAPRPPPPATAAREANDTPPATELPVEDFLSKHCRGEPIVGDTVVAANSNGSWAGYCGLVLAVPGGKLTWGARASVRCSDYFSIDLAGGASAAPAGRDKTDDGKVTWAAGSTMRAAAMGVSVRDIDVGADAAVLAPSGMSLEALGDVTIGRGAVFHSAYNGVAITGGGDVHVGRGVRLMADRGVVYVTAGQDLSVLPNTYVQAGHDAVLRAGAAAALDASRLVSTARVVVTAPTCTATNTTASAPLVQVCD